jgi:outer membrane protein OmpA-like peptidoglycan-associated protein
MLNTHFYKSFFLILFCSIGGAAFGQEAPFSCFNAQEIRFPLSDNDFSKSKILAEDQEVNALYYVYQDKYTFWYKFVATQDIKIKYIVTPSNAQDRYRSVAYKYGGKDFCDQLVNFNLQPCDVERAPLMGPDTRIYYVNTIDAAKGDTFFISVLSLNDEDCGHFLKMEALDEELSLHAIHRPCYNFVYLEMPDFSTAKEHPEDVSLFLSRFDTVDQDKEILELPDLPIATTGFGSLQTIQVESANESMVSVGDKLVLNKVFFYTNTYAFKPEAEAELDQLYAFLVDNPTVEIEIHGHSANNTEDIRPDPNYKGLGPEWNFKGSAFKLSEMRAEAVLRFLVNKGIKKKRLKAVGFGDTQKRVPDATTFEDFEKNMRVEALVVKQ